MKNSKVKYVYDYPIQREIAQNLYMDDKTIIADKLGYCVGYIQMWCNGTRRNHAIMELALQYQKINIRCRMAKEKIEVNHESPNSN